jgi:hypothetical protein
MSLKKASDIANLAVNVVNAAANVLDQPDIEDAQPKQEIVLTTRWLRKSEVSELDKWTSPAQNGRGLLKLNGKENLNSALPDFKNYEMILIDISNADNLKWLQYNIDYIRENHDAFNVSLISGKWQTEMAFHESLKPDFRLREVPLRCKDKSTFYHMLHSNYINQVKKGCFHGLKAALSFFLGRSA